jgi:C4-dicarboxylate transporter DctM subunit
VITLGLISLIIVAVILGQPLFLIMGSVVAYCFYFIGQEELSLIVSDVFYAGNKEILLAIPLFILAGNIMASGSIAKRLIRLGTVLTAKIPGGLAIASILSCAIFSAISGSSPVTLIAIGSIMYPALLKEGYSKQLSMGVLSAGGTLGIIIPPSIPMVVLGIMARVSIVDLFKAGIGPGILLTVLLSLYAIWRGEKKTSAFSIKEFIDAIRSGILAIMMPGLILGGIYSGLFTATESAAMAVVYALFVEIFIHRELKISKLPKIMLDTTEMLGTLFIILVLAVSLNKFLTYQEVPQNLVEMLSGMISSKISFLIGVNILLLIVGCMMDIMSAILVLAPLLTPMAVHFGINPVHFGIIMIVNLEIGYLTPPVGINLFVGAGIFKESLGNVINALLPLVLVLLVGLVLITFVPGIALFFN